MEPDALSPHHDPMQNGVPVPAPSEAKPLTGPAGDPKEDFLMELIKFGVLAVIIVVPLRLFIAQPFVVSGASMEPTFEDHQYLIIDELTYRLTEPKRGDVIIFRYPRDKTKYFIKRIIGLPGETVRIEGRSVTIVNDTHPDGFTLDEPYVSRMDRETFLTQPLGPNEFFVLGDNRDASSDSRVWGVLRRDLIIGRAFLRLLPIGKAEVLPGAIVPAPSEALPLTGPRDVPRPQINR